MGTELMRLHESPRFAARTEPERVALIHAQHTAAKASVILTNTFQVNPVVLGRSCTAEFHHALWQSALDAARSARPSPRYILGDIGPFSECMPKVASEVLRECKSLDGVLLETWSSLDDLRTFAHARKRSTPPLLVSFTYYRSRKAGWRTFTDEQPEACARAAQQTGAVALGVNCGRNLSMKNMREIVRRYHDACELPVFIRPNAGTPKRTASGWRYPRSPDAMAADLGPLLEEGIAMVGGCCGTTPDHIMHFRLAIDAWNEGR